MAFVLQLVPQLRQVENRHFYFAGNVEIESKSLAHLLASQECVYYIIFEMLYLTQLCI